MLETKVGKFVSRFPERRLCWNYERRHDGPHMNTRNAAYGCSYGAGWNLKVGKCAPQGAMKAWTENAFGDSFRCIATGSCDMRHDGRDLGAFMA